MNYSNEKVSEGIRYREAKAREYGWKTIIESIIEIGGTEALR